MLQTTDFAQTSKKRFDIGSAQKQDLSVKAWKVLNEFCFIHFLWAAFEQQVTMKMVNKMIFTSSCELQSWNQNPGLNLELAQES